MASTAMDSADRTDVTIDAVYFAQTHVLPPDHPYFRLVAPTTRR
jgi:hypothetical protein